ncbi:hypothetical protein FACS1894152_1500 [Bacilli bacterium]|nr:hypothetical protein FACS1894152_1500 [Bacilli bacterium]
MSKIEKLLIWSLKDERVGSSKQAEFLAKSLGGCDVMVKNVVYNILIGIPNIIRPCKVGINFKKSDELLNQNPPDIIIFGGRRLAGLAVYLKKYFLSQFNKNVKLICILNPNYSFKHFDLVLLPVHDGIEQNKYGNIMHINGSLCDASVHETELEKTCWNQKLENVNEPFFSLMIGGDTKNKKISPENFGLVVKQISEYVQSVGGTLLISTSRRTGSSCLEETLANLKCNYFIYNWATDSDVPNPYYFFIRKSSMVFLTGDSIAMMSEVATMNRPMYIYMPDELCGKKHIKFCNYLITTGIARQIELSGAKIEQFEMATKLNELEKVSEFIKKQFL